MLSIRSCSFRATKHCISDATVKCSFSRRSEITTIIRVPGAKLLISISSVYFESGCALSNKKQASKTSLSTVLFFIIFNMKKFFVMGERFFCESFSETESGKRATYFGPERSRGLYLEHSSTLRQDSILSRGS
jgi:hypothetical protein